MKTTCKKYVIHRKCAKPVVIRGKKITKEVCVKYRHVGQKCVAKVKHCKSKCVKRRAKFVCTKWKH